MTATHSEPSDGEGMAGRLVLVIDATVPAAVHQASATLAARLADEAGLPVTVATAPSIVSMRFATRSAVTPTSAVASTRRRRARTDLSRCRRRPSSGDVTA